MTAAKTIPTKRKRYTWTRINNNFPDLPILRAAASKANARVHQVVAVALRMDCIANASSPRGSVADMSVPEFAAALQLPAEVVARIRTALEDPEIGWLASDFIVDFYERNPDDCDPTASDRQRRHRENVRQTRRELNALAATGPPDLSRRDTVTVTPRYGTLQTSLHSEVPRARASGEPEWLSDAKSWLQTEGTSIICNRMGCKEIDAARRLVRWLEACGNDPAALREIINANADRVEADFHIRVADACARYSQRQSTNGEPELPFGPVPIRKAR